VQYVLLDLVNRDILGFGPIRINAHIFLSHDSGSHASNALSLLLGK
jgi:hypothetical protein